MGDNCMKLFADEIRDILKNNDMNYEVWSIDENTCEIWVMDGDWKHDHARLKYLLSRVGYEWEREIVDEEEDGDDCFSAYYTIKREVA